MNKRQQSWSEDKLIYVSQFFYILLSKWVTLPSSSALIIIYFFLLLPLRSLFIRRILKELYIFYLKRLLPLGNGILFINSVKIPQMPYYIVNFLLEVDDLLSWIVDEATAELEKVGTEEGMFSLLLSWYRYTTQYYFVVIKSWNLYKVFNISIHKTQIGKWLCSVHKVMEGLTILTFKLFKIIFHQKGILGNFKVRFIKF